MGNKVRKVIPTIVALTMMFTVTACSSDKTKPDNSQEGASSKATEAPKKEVVTLKIVEARTQGGVDTSDAVSKFILDKLGIKLEYVNTDDDKFKVMAASNDLGDIVIANSSYQKQFIDGGAVIALDELLKTHGKDILQLTPNKVAFSQKYMSQGQNKTFFLPAHALTNVQDFLNMSQFDYAVGSFVRWDLYKELGYPAVNSPDEYLKLLADMQKKHPQTGDGKKTYGIALWTDWGGWPLFSGANALGYDNWGVKSKATYIDHKGNINESLLSDNSYLWKTLKFYYKANQIGILDPDSFTQKYDNVKQKITNGQLFSNNNGWDNSSLNPVLAKSFGSEAGMGMIPTVNPAVFANGYSPVGWVGSYSVAITKNSKYPDRAMDLINYLNSYEGARLVYSGIQGTDWDVVNGKPEMKPEVLQQSATDPDFLNKRGFPRRPILSHMVGIDGAVISSADGAPMDLFILPKALEQKNTPFTKAYSEHFGVTYPGAVVEKAAKDGKIALGIYNTINIDTMPQLSDDLTRIDKQVEDYLTKLFPKVILSKSDAEADAAIATAKADLKKLGVDTLTGWETTEYQKAKAASTDFSK